MTHEHEWERGAHMAESFGVDGRRLACAICGLLKNGEPTTAAPSGRSAPHGIVLRLERLQSFGGWLDREAVLAIARGER